MVLRYQSKFCARCSQSFGKHILRVCLRRKKVAKNICGPYTVAHKGEQKEFGDQHRRVSRLLHLAQPQTYIFRTHSKFIGATSIHDSVCQKNINKPSHFPYKILINEETDHQHPHQ